MPVPGPVHRWRDGLATAGTIAISLTVLLSPLPAVSAIGGAAGAPPPAAGSAHAGPTSGASNATSPLAWLNLDAGVGSNRPLPRSGAAIAYDPSLNATILFGGLTSSIVSYTSSAALDDTWEYANGTWTQVNLDNPPAARFDAHMAWDPTDGYLLLVGGMREGAHNVTSPYNDTWAFDNQTWEKLTPTHSPPGLFEPAMTWDAADGYMLLYGGFNVTETNAGYSDYFSNGTWSFVGGQWTNRTAKVSGAPGPIFAQSMGYDVAGHQVVMFGGESETANLNATWTYSGDSWSQDVASPQPPALFSAEMATDPALEGAVMYGGVHEVSNPYSEHTVTTTWLFSNGTWTNLTAQLPVVPPMAAGAPLTYHANGGFLLQFGGDSGPQGVSNETWSLGPPILGGFSAAPSPDDVGVRAVFNATPWGSAGTVSYLYAGLPAGCPSPNASLLACVPNASGRFTVSVTLADSDGYNVSHTFVWQVNTRPQIASFTISPSAVTIGARVDIATTTSGGTPTYGYTFTGLPSGCYSHGAANFSCAPTVTGVFPVSVTLRDRAGGSAVANATLTVNVVPSILTFVAAQPTIDEGQELNLSVLVGGGTAPYRFEYAGLPPNCISEDTANLTCTPRGLGSFQVTVNVTDADGNLVNSAVMVQVDATPTLVAFTVGPAATDVGRLVGISVAVTGGTTPYQYTYLGLPPGCNGGDVASFDCTPSEPGNYTIEALVVDNTGWVLRPTTLLDVAPALNVANFSAAPSPIDAGQSITFATAVSGGTAPFTYAYLGLPAGCGGAFTASYRCQPAAGTFQVTVTAEDSVGARASLSLTISVAPPPGLELVSANVTQVTLGASISIAVAPTGGSAPYRFAYLGLPPGCPNVDTTNLTCTPTATGTYAVTVTMVDAAGVNATTSVTLEVHATNSALVTGLALGGVAALIALTATATILLRRRHRRGRTSAEPDS